MNWKKEIIRLRQDGRYEARPTIDGKRYFLYGKTKQDVQTKLKELYAEYERNNHIIAENISLDEALGDYLKSMKYGIVKDTTYDRIESTFRNHIQKNPISRKKIGKITEQDIQRLLTNKCKEGLSESSIKKIYILLGEFFRYAFNTRKIGYNPMKMVKIPNASNIKYEKKEIEALTEEQLKKVVAEAKRLKGNGEPVYRYGEAIVLALLTGVRAGELRAIHKDYYDLENQTLHICQNVTYSKDRDKKTGGIKHSVGSVKTRTSNRTVPLQDMAIEAIKHLEATTYNEDTGYLICTSKGKIVTHSNLQRCYDAILKNVGINHMGLHSTRHTYATLLLKSAEKKGQIKEVSELLGHSNITTTYQHYIKTSNNDKQELVGGLSKLVS